MRERPTPSKLCLLIVSDSDADRLLNRLVTEGFPATKIGSTGGFLRRGNATIISGVPDHAVGRVIEITRELCHARREFVPVQSLPFVGDGGFPTEPIEVRVGGATIFVLDIERFEQA